MVLSNKKLKQKLREAKAESLAAIESGEAKGNQSSITPEGNSPLQVLIEPTKQKGRLSKRERRRKNTDNKSLDGDNNGENKLPEEKKEIVVGQDDHGENGEKHKKKNGKRKRKEGDNEENCLKKATKKKNKKKKKKKVKTVEEKVAVGAEVVTDEAKGSGQSDMNELVGDKVYVGGIPYYSTEDDIRSYFESCGTITEVDCMKFPDSGKFRGIAIISLKTEAAAKRALALDGSDMGGFFLKIQPYKTTRANKVSDFAPQIIDGYNRIYVGNLPWEITEDDLKKFFSDCKITSIRWGTDKQSGEFRGFAHVDFSDNRSLLMALKLDQRILCGRPVKISCAVPLKGAKVPKAMHNGTANDGPNTKICAPMATEEESDNGGNAFSGKIRRRTCYECGEKGHISSDCPKGAKIHATAVPTTSNEAENDKLNINVPVPAAAEKEADNGGNVSSGKIRRRTCYECGEKGHIASDCTKGAKIHGTAIPTATSNEAENDKLNINVPVPAAAEKEADSGGNVSSGKIRRRTCYECGEKGHISSACPKRQIAETNSNAT